MSWIDSDKKQPSVNGYYLIYILSQGIHPSELLYKIAISKYENCKRKFWCDGSYIKEKWFVPDRFISHHYKVKKLFWSPIPGFPDITAKEYSDDMDCIL